jgi:hypothetical protein
LEGWRGKNKAITERSVVVGREGKLLTLSMTFSSEFGQSMAKHTKIRSVSG